MKVGVLPMPGQALMSMMVDQAIFTSLPRRGTMSGYHLVSRSPGVIESEAAILTRWSPSHGALLVDDANRTSVSFHALPSGRYALSRTCEGRPEYSGRGGRQLYTHTLIFSGTVLKHAAFQPFAIYRDALSLGYLRYRPTPPAALKPAAVSQLYPPSEPALWRERAFLLGLPSLDALERQIERGQPVRFTYAGDRIALAECLLGVLPTEVVAKVSLSTSLQPSAVRPFQLCLVNAFAS